MRVLLLSLGVLCAMSCTVQARQRNFPDRSTGPTFPRPPVTHRFRREPQGSVSLEAIKPLSGPDRHSSIDLNYNQRIIDNPRTALDTYGGANFHQGHVSPHAGLKFEHNFNKDMFMSGHGQLQPGPRGGLSPSFGANFGYRFRREILPTEESQVFPRVWTSLTTRPIPIHRFRRDPQGSVSLEAIKPLSGPDRHPSINLNYNHRIIDNPRTTLDTYGGANFRQGHTSPHAGLKFEHNFNKNMFVNGHGQLQPGPRGGLSPSFGANLGYRFRREIPYEDDEVAEEVY